MSEAIENTAPGPLPKKEVEDGPLPAAPAPGGNRSERKRPRWLAAGVAGVVIVLAGLAVWVGLFRGPKDDLRQLQGEWAITANGRSELGTIRIEGDRWTYVAGGQERKSYRLTLTPRASPKEIDLAQLDESGQPVTFTHGAGKGSAVKLHGVYSIEGDTASLVLVPGVEPRPTSLDASAGMPVMLLKRVKN